MKKFMKALDKIPMMDERIRTRSTGSDAQFAKKLHVGRSTLVGCIKFISCILKSNIFVHGSDTITTNIVIYIVIC